MTCPDCHKKDPIPDIAILNVESYGDKTCKTQCRHCGVPLIANIVRVVEVRDVRISDHEYDDWGTRTESMKAIKHDTEKVYDKYFKI